MTKFLLFYGSKQNCITVAKIPVRLFLILLLCGYGYKSSAQLFSQNFNSATTVTYTANTALAITGASGNNIVGTATPASQFTSITCTAKNSCGIGINDATYSGQFYAGGNNTSFNWSLVKSSNFAATAPTAIKVVINASYHTGSSSSNTSALDFAIGSGFSDGILATPPASTAVHSGFCIQNNSTAKIAAYGAPGTTLSTSGITQSSMQTITWVINNSGSTISYTNPNGGTSTLANDKWDLWQGTTQFVTAASATTGTVDLQNMYVGNNAGKNNDIKIDDITVTDLSPIVGPTLTLTPTSPVLSFGTLVQNATSAEQSYSISGTNLTNNITITPPSGFEISTGTGGSFSATNPITLAQSGGTVANTTIYVRYHPTSATGATGNLNITNTSAGATTQNVVVNGTSIATEPTTTGTINFGTTTGGSMVINLPTVGNGSKRIIVVKQGSAVTFTPTDGVTSAGVNADFSAATDKGSGNKIVYDGTGSGSSVVTVTGLNGLTTYHFAVYEYNEGTGASQNYLTSSFAIGNNTTLDGTSTTDYFRTVASGNWNAAATWESSHDNSTWISATAAPSDATANAIVIKAGHTVTVTANVSSDQLVIEAGGQLNINNGVTFTVADGTGTDVSFAGYIKNSGTITATGTIEASAATSVYEHNINNINPPAITWLAGSTLKFTGSYTGQGVNPTGRLSAGSYQNITFAGDIAAAGDYVSLGDNAVTIAGKLTVSNTGPGAVLTSAGTTSPTVAEYEQTSGVVYINRNGGGTRSLTVLGNVTISGGTLHVKTLGGATAGEFNIRGTLNATGGTITNSGSAGSALIRFEGASVQTAMFGTTTGTINYTINNAAGVTLGSDMTVNGALTFTNGKITAGTVNANGSSTYKVIIATGGSVTGGGTGWVIGNLQKAIATGATTATFEIGGTDNYRPVSVAFGNVGTAGDLTATVTQTAGDHPQIATSGIDAAKSVNRYWTLINSGIVFDNYSATFTFVPGATGEVDAGANTANFGVKRYNGSVWSSTTPGTRTATSTQATGVTSFSEFAVGEIVPFPVTITNFRGENAGTVNKLFWSTSTETNNAGFEVERSSDGVNYVKVNFTASKADHGNSTSALSYSYYDEKTPAGANYYRLKQVDNDGKYSYSNVVLLTRKVTEVSITKVYPNPGTEVLNVRILSPDADNLLLVVTDLSGKAVLHQKVNVAQGENVQQLNVASLAAGTYVVKIMCANGCESATQRFVKK